MAIEIRAYLSPTLVLLAFNWDEGKTRADFLGFAIKREPGFWSADGKTRAPESWLPNRLTFDGPVQAGQPDAPSNAAPIQKFMWWDARIDEADRGQTFTYTAYPVVGSTKAPDLLDAQQAQTKITLPQHIEDGIGTWFNRAVVSSQAFSRKVKAMGLDPAQAPPAAKALELRRWLANDLESSFAAVFDGATRAVSAVYHLTDTLWVIPALKKFAQAQAPHATAVVYDAHTGAATRSHPATPSPNQPAVDELGGIVDFHPRKATNIMHDKFIVTDAPNAKSADKGKPTRLLTGSANFTTEGLTEQANLLHVLDSPELAQLYSDRAAAISSDPTLAATAQLSHGWSDTVKVGSASVRASFSPEPAAQRTQIDTIVEAIGKAEHSVLFCLFSPTDAPLRDACFAAGDKGLMMFGLVNAISAHAATTAEEKEENGEQLNATELTSIALYHRNQHNRDVVDGEYFSTATVPEGFDVEMQLFPGEKRPPYPPVIIHHKFLVIDAEGENPIVYTGSANMSNNSEHKNDENLLEIRDRRVAAIYLAEFLRLYEHYRARALAIKAAVKKTPKVTLALEPDRHWADKYYVDGSPESKARIALAAEPAG
ncbi:phospholipase [Burkholderia sp. SG-MS1]|uniref:phospholipase D-like domain-containing protein n=1 Tax=Paraburkholderia sp. SG-MS1 TaxID=2023741 RepID=UPI001444B5C8|nr:phospholipase D-like domain-containing protein [Paraburkholderia sp. SG-MS1]NKJ50649.1 phospholipase [Paraburkholderia sp. SG-MS1]